MIQVQKRMLVEQRAVIERLSCKLGKDHEDVELQFSAAVAKVMTLMMLILVLMLMMMLTLVLQTWKRPRGCRASIQRSCGQGDTMVAMTVAFSELKKPLWRNFKTNPLPKGYNSNL